VEQLTASLSMGGRSLCHASLVFRIRGRVKVLGLGFCVRVRVKVSVTGSVSYLNDNCSLHTLLLLAPVIHRQSSPTYQLTWYCQDTYKVRSAKMRKCENGQRIQCEIKCEVVFAFYTLQRISYEVEIMRNATI